MEHNSNGLGGGGGSGGGSSNSMPLDYQPFKSRFLKTERSAALLKEEASESSSLTSKAPPVPGSLRSLRSTFSPTRLSRLPENIEVRDGVGTSNGDSANNDQLSKSIQAFITRTDHAADEWKNLGPKESKPKRSGSVERGSFEDYSISMRPSRSVRASSATPSSNFVTKSGNTSLAGFYRNNPESSSGYGSGSVYRDFSCRSSVRSVSHSVTNRARDNRAGQVFVRAPQQPTQSTQRFMSLEEECNWILSGREPLNHNDNGYDDDEESDEDNTLDDISGDEVTDVKDLQNSYIHYHSICACALKGF